MGGLMLAGHQAPIKATPSFISSSGQGRESITKGLWGDIRVGRDHSPVTIKGKTYSAWTENNLVYYQSSQ